MSLQNHLVFCLSLDLFLLTDQSFRGFQSHFKVIYKSILNKILAHATKIFSDFTKFMEAAIKEHEESLDENNPRDFIDMFLIQSRNDTIQIYTKKQLIR